MVVDNSDVEIIDIHSSALLHDGVQTCRHAQELARKYACTRYGINPESNQWWARFVVCYRSQAEALCVPAWQDAFLQTRVRPSK